MIDVYIDNENQRFDIEVDGVEVGNYPLKSNYIEALRNGMHNALLELENCSRTNNET